jgi:hypothetical protein
MGGMGFISVAECEVLRNNALISLRQGDKETRGQGDKVIRRQGEGCSSSPPHLFSSSVCVYRDMQPSEPALTEDDAIPANPDNEYGWEKLYAERVAMAYGRRYGMNVRTARFENFYGRIGAHTSGRATRLGG